MLVRGCVAEILESSRDLFCYGSAKVAAVKLGHPPPGSPSDV